MCVCVCVIVSAGIHQSVASVEHWEVTSLYKVTSEDMMTKGGDKSQIQIQPAQLTHVQVPSTN